MACDQYNAGTNAEITFTEHTLPANFCPATWQDTLHGFLAAISANLPGAYATFVISATAPSPNDRDKLWLQVDAATCKPVGFFLYFQGEWVRVDGTVFYGEDISTTANLYQVDTVTPNINYLTAGSQIYVIKATKSNTGPCTLTLNNLTVPVVGVAITKYGTNPLTEMDILANQLMVVVYDGTQFQLINPRPNLPTDTTIVDDIQNGSFELDSNNDGIPDFWSWDSNCDGLVNPGIYSAPTGAIDMYGHPVHSGNQSGNGKQSFMIQQVAHDITTHARCGSLTMVNYIPCNPKEILEFSWWFVAQSAYNVGVASPFSIEVIFYDENKAECADGTGGGPTKTLYFNPCTSSGTTQTFPTGTWRRMLSGCAATATSRFFRLRIITGFRNSKFGDPDVTLWNATTDRKLWFDNFKWRPVDPRSTLVCNLQSDWFIPTGIYTAKITCVGKGGTGGVSVGGGGGGGEMAVKWLYGFGPSVALGFMYTALPQHATSARLQTVPAGTVVCQAIVGANAAGINGGAGGAGGTGDYLIAGKAGQNGVVALSSGPGGASAMGGGGGGIKVAGAGITGSGYGGGGGGSFDASPAGTGAIGVVIIEFYDTIT